MTTAVARPKSRKRSTAQPPLPWWGDRGIAPHLRWPGTTIEIQAVWVPLKGAKKVAIKGDEPREAWLLRDGTEIPDWWGEAGGRWESPDGRFYFDAGAANKACDFFPTFLTHHIGKFAGQPFELMEYQRLLVVMPLYGWLRSNNGMRRFRIVFLFVPKGNGKSPVGSGIGLELTICENEPGAEVFALAGDKLQAKVVHEDAKLYVEDSPDLEEACEVTRDSIYYPPLRSSYQVLSADAPGKHGRRPFGIIIDELHNQKNRDLFEAFRKSMIKGEQPIMLMMSHAGTEEEESICYEEYDYAREVMKDPSRDDSYLPIIFEATDKDDWTSEAVWRRVNPGFGITINPEIFASECRAAQLEPRKKNDFLRYNLDRWVNQAVAWIPIEWWDACPSTVPDDLKLKPLPCTAGLDMAQKIDLAAFVITFKEPLEIATTVEVVAETETGQIEKKTVSLNFKIHLLPFFWIPESTMKERELEDKIPYSVWKELGFVTATEGVIIDYDRIYKDILALGERFPLLKQGQIGYDPAFATDIAMKLQGAGFQMVEVLQNYKYMSEPCQVYEALLKAGRVTHTDNKCMRWNMGNVAIKTDDAGRIRPVKSRKSKKKIDGVVAAIMGISRLIVQAPPRSYGVTVL